MSNVKSWFVHNPIINITVMLTSSHSRCLIIIRNPWSVLALYSLRNANMLSFRLLNGTDNPQLNAFDYCNSFTFFYGIQNNAPFKRNNLLFVLLN